MQYLCIVACLCPLSDYIMTVIYVYEKFCVLYSDFYELKIFSYFYIKHKDIY